MRNLKLPMCQKQQNRAATLNHATHPFSSSAQKDSTAQVQNKYAYLQTVLITQPLNSAVRSSEKHVSRDGDMGKKNNISLSITTMINSSEVKFVQTGM